MLARAANSSRDDAASHDDSQDNCLAAGTEHSSDDFQLIIGESLDQNEGSTDGTVLNQPRNKSKAKRKAGNLSDVSLSKAKKWAWTNYEVYCLSV